MLVAVLPARNEESRIAGVINDVQRRVDVTVVVDDASQDETGQIARNLGCVVLRNYERAGYGTTLRRGLLWCSEIRASAIVTVDADGQHDAEWIGQCAPLINEGVDVVFANRFALFDKAPETKILSNNFAWHCLKRVIGRSPICEDVSCGFRMYSRRGLKSTVEASLDPGLGYAFTHATCLQLHRSGLRLAAISTPAIYPEPFVGTQVTELLDFLRWLSTCRPLRIAAKRWLHCIDRGLPISLTIERWRTGEILHVIGERIGEEVRFSRAPRP